MLNASTDSTANSTDSPKPVNFDFPDARCNNPRLVHPVPVRLSPESPVIPTSDDDLAGANGGAPVNLKQPRREVTYQKLWDDHEALSSTTSAADESLTLQSQTLRTKSQDTDEEDLECSTTEVMAGSGSPGSPLPRDDPLPPPPPSAAHFSNALKSNPPVLPPRPHHARSSSLDLNQAKQGLPALPPRNSSIAIVPEEGAISNVRQSARALQLRIHQMRDKNSVVARTINELHQEVSDTLEERITLEFRLEQLKSFGD